TTTSAPSERQPHILVLTATGDAKVDSISYVVDGKQTDVGATALPWRAPLTIPMDGGRHEWSLTLHTHAGSVQALGIFDGAVSAQSAGGGTGSGTISVSGDVSG